MVRSDAKGLEPNVLCGPRKIGGAVLGEVRAAPKSVAAASDRSRLLRRCNEVARLVLMRCANGVVFDRLGAALVFVDAWAAANRPNCDWSKCARRALTDMPQLGEHNVDDAIDRTARLFAQKGANYRPMTTEVAGRALELQSDERAELRIVTMYPADATKEQVRNAQVEAKRLRERERQRVKRAGQHVPRAEYLANAHTATRQWELEGISRRTWERRRKSGVASVLPTDSVAVSVSRATDLRQAVGRSPSVGLGSFDEAMVELNARAQAGGTPPADSDTRGRVGDASVR